MPRWSHPIWRLFLYWWLPNYISRLDHCILLPATHFLLHFSSYISNRHLKFNISETKLLIFLPPCFSHYLLLEFKNKFTLLSSQIQNLDVLLNSCPVSRSPLGHNPESLPLPSCLSWVMASLDSLFLPPNKSGPIQLKLHDVTPWLETLQWLPLPSEWKSLQQPCMVSSPTAILPSPITLLLL